MTILCGSGCAGAHDELLALGERLKAPMVHALRGKEHVEWDNPYDVGMTGLIGFSSGYYAMLDCDVLLMLGTDFPYRQFYPQGAGVRIAQVDIRAEHHRTPRTRSILAWWAMCGRRSAPCCRGSSRSADEHASRRRRASIMLKARKALDDLAAGTPGQRTDPPAASRQGDQRPGRRRTPSSPAMSACRRYGPRAISR